VFGQLYIIILTNAYTVFTIQCNLFSSRRNVVERSRSHQMESGSNGYCWIEVAQSNEYIFPSTHAGDFLMTLTSECNMLFGRSSNSQPMLNLSSATDTVYANARLIASNISISDYGTQTQPSLTWNDTNGVGFFIPNSSEALSVVTSGNERLRVTSDGSIGVNTQEPTHTLHVNGSLRAEDYAYANTIYFDQQILPITANSEAKPSYSWSNDTTTGMYLYSSNQIGLSAGGFTNVFIGSNLGIGIDVPHSDCITHISGKPIFHDHNGSRLVLEGDSSGSYFRTASNMGNIKAFIGGIGGVVVQSHSNDVWRDRVAFGRNGNMQIFGTSPNGLDTAFAIECLDNAFRIRTIELEKTLIINGSSNIVLCPDTQNLYKLTLTNHGLRFNQSGSSSTPSIGWEGAPGSGIYSEGSNICVSVNGTESVKISETALVVNGSISGNSKNFLIDHPIRKGYKLVHASVEAPRFDLLYRGITKMIRGHSVVDLDSQCNQNGGMTSGTFQELCGDCQVFLQNNDPASWDIVKGYVENGKLIIYSNNVESSSTIDWMVIGERRDKSLSEAQFASSNGRLMTEIIHT